MLNAKILIFNDGYRWEDIADLSNDRLEVTCVPGGTRQQLLEQIADCDAYIPACGSSWTRRCSTGRSG